MQSLFKAEFADETRVLKQGGADKLPAGIRRRTTNPYQTVVLRSFRNEKKRGTRMIVGGELLGIAMNSWTPKKVTFQACEDYSRVKYVDRRGREVKQKPGVRTVQKFFVIRTGQTWRIKDANATIVDDFKSAPCNGKWYS